MRTSCIRLRANSRLAILFEDFLEICDGDMLAALLLAILVYWTDIKLAKKDTNLWIWKSHEDFQEDLMVDKPGMKPPHRTTISKKLDDLQAKDFIEWRKNPKLALDRTRHYLVHLPEVQAAIDRLPPIVSRKTDIRLLENRHSTEQASEAPSDNPPNVEKPTVAESRKTDNALSKKQHCIVEKPTSNTNDYITEITPSEITEEGTYGANAPTPAHLIRNEYGELIEVPADLAEKALASQRKVLDLPEPSIPTPAHLSSEELHEKVDGAIIGVETVQRHITGEHPVVKPTDTESHYHIAESAIGNEERVVAPALTLPSKGGSTHDMASNRSGNCEHTHLRHDNRHQLEHQDEHPNAQTTARDDYAPSPGTVPSSARMTPEQAPGALTRVQAQPLSAPTPAQAEFPPAGSVASGAPTARARGFTPPKRPRAKRPPVMPETPEEIILTPQEHAFWSLWCGVWFNKDVLPNLTPTAYGHVKTLAPFITTEDDLKSLIIYARYDLQASSGVKRKAIQLGNLVNSYRGWKQEQTAQGPPQDWVPDENDYSTRAQLWRQEHMARSGK